MKLDEFMSNLYKINRKGKKYRDLIVVSASDEEGNSYRPVEFRPMLGVFDEDTYEFVSLDTDDELTVNDVNAVCID